MEKIKNPKIRVVVKDSKYGTGPYYSIQLKKKFLFWEFWIEKNKTWSLNLVEDYIGKLKTDLENKTFAGHSVGQIIHEE